MIRKHITIWMLFSFFFLLSCNQTINHDSKSNKLYNPKIDKEYFYPNALFTLELDTIVNNYKIIFSIIPLHDSLVTVYQGYFDTLDNQTKTAKVHYRDSYLKILISSNIDNFNFEREIFKQELKSILKPTPTNYFFREINFIELNNDEFRFDIKLSLLDSKKPNAMIKYFITKGKETRFEDFPKSFYDKEFPSPD